jgi:hypothetical protein
MRKGRELNAYSEGQKEVIGRLARMSLKSLVTKDAILKHYKYQIFIVFFSTILSACATSGDAYESAGDPVTVRGNDCILQSSIRDYRTLDDRNLIVSAGARGKYLVELSRKAFGLQSGWSIAFASPAGRICSGSGEILVDDGFGRKEAIRLSSIRKISQDELDALLVQYGKKDPETERAVEPREVEGAAVEELD